MDKKSNERKIQSQKTINNEIIRIEKLQEKGEDLYNDDEISKSLCTRWEMTGLAIEPFRFQRLDLTKDQGIASPEPNAVIIQDFEAKIILKMLKGKETDCLMQNQPKDFKNIDEKQVFKVYVSWEDAKKNILFHLKEKQRKKKERKFLIENPCKNFDRRMDEQQQLRFQVLHRLQNPCKGFTINLQGKQQKEKDSLNTDERIEQSQNKNILVKKHLKKFLSPIAMFAFYKCLRAITNRKV